MSKNLIIGQHRSLEASSVAFLDLSSQIPNFEIFIRERKDRKKRASDLTFRTLLEERKKWQGKQYRVAETNYGLTRQQSEIIGDKRFPWKEFVKAQGLERFSIFSKAPPKFVTHHLSHAAAACFVSPFKKALVVVADGAGSHIKTFESGREKDLAPRSKQAWMERLSVYKFEDNKIMPLEKQWQSINNVLKKPWSQTNLSWGLQFEYISIYIFGHKDEAGKVMGLAAYGRDHLVEKFEDLKKLAPAQAMFRGRGKKLWESSANFQLYADLAASMQGLFVRELTRFIQRLKRDYPEFENLILTGGCALNCAANGVLTNLHTFDQIYSPPFPGDESVALGAAVVDAMKSEKLKLKPIPPERQSSYYGPVRDNISSSEMKKLFGEYKITKPSDLAKQVGKALAKGKIVAIYSGRSEAGPRALGHRSIIADPSISNLQKYLNNKVKFRESFRPYGGTVLDGYQGTYFVCDNDFQSPFMNFAVYPHKKYIKPLKAIIHKDGSSRIQTLTKEQDRFYFDVIKNFGDLSGIYCVLNTSLNVMGEPIAETPEDALRFFVSSPVKMMVVDRFLVEKK